MELIMSLENISELSRFFGKDSRYVLAGGGNTSFKDEKFLYVKPRGMALADISASDFVKMERNTLRVLFSAEVPSDSDSREKYVNKLMMNAVSYDSKGKPSVEAPLHELVDFAYVVHLHPALVNGMTCGKNGKEKAAELFPDALWIDYATPGYDLAKAVSEKITEYKKRNSKSPAVIFIRNHGVFAGSDSVDGIKKIYAEIFEKLEGFYKKQNLSIELNVNDIDMETVAKTAPALRAWLADETAYASVNTLNPFKAAEGPLTPDHVFHAKSFAFSSVNPDKNGIAEFEKKYSFKPAVVEIPGKAVFCAGKTYDEALTVAELAKDAALIQQLAEAFGGAVYIGEKERKLLENYDLSHCCCRSSSSAKLKRKIAVVTGGAQGFGYGIAEELVKAGVTVVIADLNFDGADKAAKKLCADFGRNKAFALDVNISSEESVARMMAGLVAKCGGLDILVANAGVVRAGSVKSMALKDWEFVTDVNYTGYFLSTKYAAQVMAIQNKEGSFWTDIVQINSKSGLQGSNKNGAYAGSKFGTIGLTQSFAMELIEDKVKVNSVCPGNFFDGPLWSDPVKGLFVQYLGSGKVPGAKTVADVKKFYESKIPLNRGCFPVDVAKAIIYAVEQGYETGQAIPVTGGQVMLN